jgi:UDP-N-acetylglucosamine--N-acetylmuramyl-(pentapeptide) pyrophosphoryl-undecaprenol N-acetylglucosamine transferase
MGCDVCLLISNKEVDQQAVRSAVGMEVVTLPAVGLELRRLPGFIRGCWSSYIQARRCFSKRAPEAVLAMGGFTSAPPILAGLRCGAATLLHEANSIPGRANRWLAPWVQEVLTYFPGAAQRVANQNAVVTGMPVRPEFCTQDPAACRLALGLDPQRDVLLIMGGSQGAGGINDLMLQALPLLRSAAPDLQWLHLSGTRDDERIRAALSAWPGKARVFPFLTEMELALGAATVAVSRAGASSIAELAALRVPSILIPFPAAADNHQYHNARTLAGLGAAILVEQRTATPESILGPIVDLLRHPARRTALASAMGAWHRSDAAQVVAQRVLARMGNRVRAGQPARGPSQRLNAALPS